MARRRARRNPPARFTRRRARRNPQFLGALPPLKSILYVGAGLVVPPLVATQIMKFLPTEWATSKPAFYAVKAASVVLPGMLIKKFVSNEAGNLVLLGGAASFAIDLLKETGLLTQLGLSGAPSQPFLGYYPGLQGMRGMRGLRGVGEYPAGAPAPRALMSSPMLQNIPDRNNPNSRF